MKLQLLNQPIYESATEQILFNRGILPANFHRYLNTTDADINDPSLLGDHNLSQAAAALIKNISLNKKALVLVDCDCDGYCSAALLINYLHDLFPTWVETKLDCFIHSGKQHGLSDVKLEDYADFGIFLIPDASSNDYEYHETLANMGIDIVILDHHEAPYTSPNAITINNQLSDYPNKHFCGAGITWQFCRYLDSMLGYSYADNYRDLVALANTADMMDLRGFETKHLIVDGFRDENIHNPFIKGIAEKNAFTIGSKITSMGAAYYIAPFVNAMVRSGEKEEKEILFSSMINHLAYRKIPSTKRGHKPGEMETIVMQALRTATNVKNRQTRIEETALEKLESLIEKRNLLDHKVLMFLLEPGQVDRNVAGLVANRIMGKYQRPVCMLTRVEEKTEDGIKVTYQGSARGCDLAGVSNFKDICERTSLTEWQVGHQGAFGLSILESNIDYFINATDIVLSEMTDEPIYYVDYIYNDSAVNAQNILDIAMLDDLWGQNMPEPYVAVKGLKVKKDMVTVYEKKDLTLKITLPNRVSLILFKAPPELCDKLQNQNTGYVVIDLVGRCNKNVYNGFISAQIMIKDYEIVGETKWNF